MTVENVGEAFGSHSVLIKLDGAAITSKVVILDGGGSTEITFMINIEVEGRHVIEVDGLSEKITTRTVKKPLHWVYVAIAAVVIFATFAVVFQKRSH